MLALDEYLDKGSGGQAPGLLVVAVVKDRPAAAAGLTAGDLGTHLAGQPVRLATEAQKIAAAAMDPAAACRLPVTLQRDQGALDVTLEIPAPAPAATANPAS